MWSRTPAGIDTGARAKAGRTAKAGVKRSQSGDIAVRRFSFSLPTPRSAWWEGSGWGCAGIHRSSGLARQTDPPAAPGGGKTTAHGMSTSAATRLES